MTFTPEKHPEYHVPKLLSSGEVAAVQKMLFTTAIVVGLDDYGYRTRFCFDGPRQWEDAIEALQAWNGNGFPPGYWLKQKPEDKMNPLRKKDVS